MAGLTLLNLGNNQIDDFGMTAFAEAIKPVNEGGIGAMAQCQTLDLGGNQIGDAES